MKIKKISAVLAVILLVSVTAGCVTGNRGTLNYTRTTTTGQELIDLKEAKDKGTISDEEYEKIKANIIKSSEMKVEVIPDDKDKACED